MSRTGGSGEESPQRALTPAARFCAASSHCCICCRRRRAHSLQIPVQMDTDRTRTRGCRGPGYRQGTLPELVSKGEVTQRLLLPLSRKRKGLGFHKLLSLLKPSHSIWVTIPQTSATPDQASLCSPNRIEGSWQEPSSMSLIMFIHSPISMCPYSCIFPHSECKPCLSRPRFPHPSKKQNPLWRVWIMQRKRS